GQIGRHGANSAGIALNANGLGARFGKGVGIPQPFIRRRVLESTEMQGALKAVFDSKQSVCTNLLITPRDGFAIDLETTPAPHGRVEHRGSDGRRVLDQRGSAVRERLPAGALEPVPS